MLTPGQLCDSQRSFGTLAQGYKKRRGCFYDAVLLTNTGTNTIPFFVNPLGQADPYAATAGITYQKSKEHTNVTRQRQLQDDLWLTSIGLDIRMLPKGRQHATIVADADAIFDTYVAVMDDLLNLAGKGVLTVKFNNALFYEIPMPFFACPPGFGPDIKQWATAIAAATPPAKLSSWFQLCNDPGKRYIVNPMQFIERDQNLDISIDFPNGNTPTLSTVSGVAPRVEVRIYLEGHRAMPVQ